MEKESERTRLMSKPVPYPRTLLLVLFLLAGVALLLALTPSPAEAATTFTVNVGGDANDRRINGVCDTSSTTGRQCTLRAAIQEANATFNSGGPDKIDFAIGGTATVKTISPTRPLPAITESVIIDGYTQGSQTADTSDDAKPNDNPFPVLGQVGTDAVIKVQIKGTNAGATANGLRVTTSDTTIKGLAINRFAQSGILIKGSLATGNKVEGTFIGTDASGTLALPNAGNGVRIAGAPENTIGGNQPAQFNLISGNVSNGVEISGSGATSNLVGGNYIGTDASALEDLGNSSDGVRIQGAPDNTIGEGFIPGTAYPVKSNLIAGNDSDGVSISGSGATGNQVAANSIGFEYIDGSVSVTYGNSGHGVHIDGASSTTIGVDFQSGNYISYNGGDGVFVASGTGNNILLGNSFVFNGGLGIDLSGGTEDSFGVTANDEDDPDTGANNLQNFPVITSVVYNGTTDTTTISGTLNSIPNQSFIIRFYSIGGYDPSNHSGQYFTLV
jgi:hypothetical protein